MDKEDGWIIKQEAWGISSYQAAPPERTFDWSNGKYPSWSEYVEAVSNNPIANAISTKKAYS
ncbi:hypothetical protein FACS1894122_11810 [Alphaproteobacteria bacterium]|nr:hypothetical protein FACS1894122_11810 [Alphaproteobacteria bacterium]